MIQEVVIAAFVLVALHWTTGDGVAPDLEPVAGTRAWLVCLAPFVVLAAIAQVAAWRAARSVDRGKLEAASRLELVLLLVRAMGIVWHGVNCLALGWPALVRGTIGDLVFLDEWLAAAPPIMLVLGSWWWFYPIERRFREAILARRLHEGKPVHPWPSRRGHVWFWTRQSILPVLIPFAIASVWFEVYERVKAYVDAPAGTWLSWVMMAGQFAGVLAMLAVGPMVLKRVWSTEKLPESSLRDRLVAVCVRSGVKVRELLLWRTGGTLHNAAVLGFLGPARYILVTDAMVENMPPDLVEAVAAHEVGHLRKRHMVWLVLALVSAVMAGGMIASWLVWAGLTWARTRLNPPDEAIPMWRDAGDGVSIILTLLMALVWFGWVSRRFEWQADAFAASDLTRASGESEPAVTGEAAARVSDALGLVAAYNGISPTRFMWRHGSIRTRQRKILSLIGKPRASLGIDRDVGMIKLLTLLAIATPIGLMAYDAWTHRWS